MATRISVLAALCEAGAGPTGRPGGTAPTPDLGDLDPAVRLWRTWREALAEQDRLSARRDRLEAALVRTVEAPRVPLSSEQGGTDVLRYAYDGRTIDRAFGGLAETQARRRSLKAELRRRKSLWTARTKESGLPEALALERAADRRLDQLTNAMAAVEAHTIEGVMGKLFVALEMGEAGPHDGRTLPWSHIRSALSDLLRLAASSADPSSDPDRRASGE